MTLKTTRDSILPSTPSEEEKDDFDRTTRFRKAQLSTLKELQENVYDDLVALKVGLPKFSAHKNGTNQTEIVSGVWTKVTFVTEEYDVGGTYDAPNSKWIPGIVGKGHIDAVALWLTAVDGSQFYCAIYKNGVLYKSTALTASGTGAQAPLLSCDVPVDVVTDYFEIYVLQVCGEDKSIYGGIPYTWFMGHMLS